MAIWPRDDEGRRICNSEHPMPKDYPAAWLWAHPNASEDGECPHGCCVDFRCPHCGHWWRRELPE